MALSTGDWITIIGTSVQVLAAIGVGIWQGRKTCPAQPAPPATGSKGFRFDWRAYLRSALPYLFMTTVAVLSLWQSIASSTVVTKSFVIEVVAFSFMLLFGLVGACVMAIATALSPAFRAMDKALENIDNTFQRRLEKPVGEER